MAYLPLKIYEFESFDVGTDHIRMRTNILYQGFFTMKDATLSPSPCIPKNFKKSRNQLCTQLRSSWEIKTVPRIYSEGWGLRWVNCQNFNVSKINVGLILVYKMLTSESTGIINCINFGTDRVNLANFLCDLESRNIDGIKLM